VREDALEQAHLVRGGDLLDAKAFCFEGGDDFFNLFVAHGLQADDFSNVVEIDALGRRMALSECGENVVDEGHATRVAGPGRACGIFVT